MENKHVESKMDIQHESGNQSESISTSEFLDFLKLACRVHESIILKDGHESRKPLDYNVLAKNELVNTLLTSKLGQSPKSNDRADESCNEKNGSKFVCK